MKPFFNYAWWIASVLFVIHGANVILGEWKIKSIHTHGEMVDIKIEELNCSKGIMSFHFGANLFEKRIDARTCVIFNESQKIKLKHSIQYPDIFLFANERNPNLFVLGGLEIALGILGILTNWPVTRKKRSLLKKFPTLSEN
jgi:hypothetical protein